SARRELARAAPPPLQRPQDRALPRPLVESDGYPALSNPARCRSARNAGLRLGAVAARSHHREAPEVVQMKTRKVHLQQLLGKLVRDPDEVKVGRILSVH